MRIRRGSLYLADLDPRRGSEPGKVRPVLVIQTDLLIDQSRAIDNGRFVRALRVLPQALLREVEQKLRRLGDL